LLRLRLRTFAFAPLVTVTLLLPLRLRCVAVVARVYTHYTLPVVATVCYVAVGCLAYTVGWLPAVVYAFVGFTLRLLYVVGFNVVVRLHTRTFTFGCGLRCVYLHGLRLVTLVRWLHAFVAFSFPVVVTVDLHTHRTPFYPHVVAVPGLRWITHVGLIWLPLPRCLHGYTFVPTPRLRFAF